MAELLTQISDKEKRREKSKKSWRDYILSGCLFLSFLACWEFLVPDSMRNALPKPHVIGEAMVQYWPNLSKQMMYTASEALMGFALGNLIAVIMAATFVYSQSMADTVYPLAVILKSIPLVALTPFVVIFFGQGMLSKVVIAAILCFFPTLVNMVQGLTAIDIQALELMHTLNANGRQMFWKMRFPYSLPYLFTSFKITSSAAVLGAIIGEWMGAWRGLGAVIIQAMYNMRGAQLWSAMAMATALSIVAYVLTVLAERMIIPWHSSLTSIELTE
jgi:NitT/TauT family transport system permease protein